MAPPQEKKSRASKSNTDQNRPSYIVVEGPIGVGKTTLVTKLSEFFPARTVLEIVEENPFLPDFYEDRDKFAFQTQLFFLLSRYKQQQDLWQPDLFHRHIFSDYMFAKDRIFATLTLSNNEMLLYDQVFQILDTRVIKPDLVIYLQARMDILQDRIKTRGRSFEKNFDMEYLKKLSQAYNDYFFHYSDTPLLVVDTSEVNFAISQEDLMDLAKTIQRHRGGVQFYKPISR
jgi:deoxyadenosine/deoxycytidine kinase